jgi:two-component system, cell cycle sensor histidine kinase and response regulator CckA
MPLGITGHAHLLMESLHPSDARVEHTEAILGSAQRCGDLSRQLLAFSRRQLLELRVVDLREVVKQVATLLRGTLHADVRLEVLLPAEPCLVQADVGQIEQVLINLAINAQDAMPRGGTLTIAIDTPSGRGVELVVADTGCGMDSVTREHAFEPFFTTKEPGKGTGLGLAMVYGIVKQHEGTIVVDSEEGRGTTFRVYLKRVAAEEAVEAAPAESRPAAGSGTILLVEDEDDVRDLAREILAADGFTVLEAATPGEALRVADRHTAAVDLVVTDVVMPEMSGRELAVVLLERWPTTPVLYISGYSQDAIAQHGVLDAGTTLLAKPFTPGELRRTVARLLERA